MKIKLLKFLYLPSLLLLVYVTSCGTIRVPQPTATPTHALSFEAFRLDNQCPHVCWLGIHPGSTTQDEALHLIKSSDQFDQQFTKLEDSAIAAYWFVEKTREYKANIYIPIVNGTVDSIIISGIEPFTVDDFVRLFGTPKRISFLLGEYPYEGGFYMIYNLYYSSLEAKLEIQNPVVRGPNSADTVDVLYLGTEFDNQFTQPWIGYRTLEDYFPQGTPTVRPPNSLE